MIVATAGLARLTKAAKDRGSMPPKPEHAVGAVAGGAETVATAGERAGAASSTAALRADVVARVDDG